MKKTIVFTGGGSAGHVTPNIGIMKELDPKKWDMKYIGSKKGIEKELIEKLGIPYYGISSGKLRRYIDFENVADAFRVLKGCIEARRILNKIKPALIFSKGGFVSVPVIIAARSLGIPAFIHESDMTPGLANKISQRFAARIFTSFEESAKFFPSQKTKVIGSPIRNDILKGSSLQGKKFLGFDGCRPILMVMGGSLGAKKINETVRGALPQLLENYQIVHLCGKGNLEPSLEVRGYKQFEYIHDELPDILSATDIVITRGGSNAIFEFLALNIPMLIIPLSRQQSRGDQILNAKSFTEKGYAVTLEEEELTTESLVSNLQEIQQSKEKIKNAMKNSGQGSGLQTLVEEINSF